MSKIIRSLLIMISFVGIHCVSKSSGSLVVVAIPQTPILIPNGPPQHFGTRTISPPFFMVRQINVSYQGAGRINIFDLEFIHKTNGVNDFTCGFVGDEFAQVFSGSTDAKGQVIMSQGQTLQTQPIVCAGIPLPNPLPETFNIPMTVRINATTIDSNNNPTGRIKGEAVITIQ